MIRLFELNRKLLLEYERIALEQRESADFNNDLYLKKIGDCFFVERLFEHIALSGEVQVVKLSSHFFNQIPRLWRDGGWDMFHSDHAVELVSQIEYEYKELIRTGVLLEVGEK